MHLNQCSSQILVEEGGHVTILTHSFYHMKEKLPHKGRVRGEVQGEKEVAPLFWLDHCITGASLGITGIRCLGITGIRCLGITGIRYLSITGIRCLGITGIRCLGITGIRCLGYDS